MTWWDHETRSVWSQVSGEALKGPLAGMHLRQIPATVETWATWRIAHPGTAVLDNGRGVPELLETDVVIGIRLNGDAAAFSFSWAVEQGVVNDQVGGVPIALVVQPNGVIRVYSRAVDGRVIVFEEDMGQLVDPASWSRWDPGTGRPLAGTQAERLEPVPWVTFYPEAWQRFYPDARLVS
jgi:hypothetical protein